VRQAPVHRDKGLRAAAAAVEVVTIRVIRVVIVICGHCQYTATAMQDGPASLTPACVAEESRISAGTIARIGHKAPLRATDQGSPFGIVGFESIASYRCIWAQNDSVRDHKLGHQQRSLVGRYLNRATRCELRCRERDRHVQAHVQPCGTPDQLVRLTSVSRFRSTYRAPAHSLSFHRRSRLTSRPAAQPCRSAP